MFQGSNTYTLSPRYKVMTLEQQAYDEGYASEVSLCARNIHLCYK